MAQFCPQGWSVAQEKRRGRVLFCCFVLSGFYNLSSLDVISSQRLTTMGSRASQLHAMLFGLETQSSSLLPFPHNFLHLQYLLIRNSAALFAWVHNELIDRQCKTWQIFNCFDKQGVLLIRPHARALQLYTVEFVEDYESMFGNMMNYLNCLIV